MAYEIINKAVTIAHSVTISGVRRKLTNSDRTYALCVLKDRTNTPQPPNGWVNGTFEFALTTAKYNVGDNKVQVEDELGNLYVDVTDLL
jgi:hypothetical protein